jgi:DNA-binding protein HU-beta/integration host factor subunit alpha
MNNKEFITELAKRTGYSADDTQKMVRTIIDAMSSEFENGEAVTVPGFGAFEIKKKLERVVINPGTQQKMLVPPKLVLNFRPVSGIKEKLKNLGQDE